MLQPSRLITHQSFSSFSPATASSLPSASLSLSKVTETVLSNTLCSFSSVFGSVGFLPRQPSPSVLCPLCPSTSQICSVAALGETSSSPSETVLRTSCWDGLCPASGTGDGGGTDAGWRAGETGLLSACSGGGLGGGARSRSSSGRGGTRGIARWRLRWRVTFPPSPTWLFQRTNT